jgi:hypothetical protein
MKSVNGQIIVLALVLLALLQGSSCESTSDSDRPHPARFELTMDKPEGTAPDTVTFTGKLYGDIDALVMCHPDFCFCPHESPGMYKASMELAGPLPETCICYSLCDSTLSAKRSYVETYIYQESGTYKASMKLNCANGTFSDTVVVHVQ